MVRAGGVELRFDDSEIVHDEIFDLVLTLQTFEDEGHAVALTKRIRYGFAGIVYTANAPSAERRAMQCPAVSPPNARP